MSIMASTLGVPGDGGWPLGQLHLPLSDPRTPPKSSEVHTLRTDQRIDVLDLGPFSTPVTLGG
jgi:hypothetical protein